MLKSTANQQRPQVFPQQRQQSGVQLKPVLDKDSVYDGLLFELEDVSRLATIPRIDNYFYESIQKTTYSFHETVLRALIPIRRGRQLPHRDDKIDTLATEIEDIDESFLDRYVQISSLEGLDRARQAIHQKVDLVINHPDYVDAVDGYRKQQSGGIWRNTLYAFLAKNGFTHAEHITPKTPLYHGLCISGDDSELDCNEKQQLLAPDAYVGKLKSILANGIKATPNAENLPCLDSAFCVTNIKNAYGLLAVSFSISDRQKLWNRSGPASMSSEGYQLVVPVVQKPIIQKDFQVLIRSAGFFNDMVGAATKDVFGQISKEEHRSYVSQLIKSLKAAGIDFQMIDPDGTVRPPKTKPLIISLQ